MRWVQRYEMPFSAVNLTATRFEWPWRQHVGRACWLRLRGRHRLSTRSRCAPMRSQLRLLRLLAPASLTAGASAAASARSQILLQRGGARNLLLSPTALSTITCALACPHLRCRASRLAMRKRACAGCRAPRLNRLPSVASRPCARQVARCRRRDRDESPTEAALLVAPVLVGASVLTLLGTLVVGAVLVVTVRASLAACCWVCPPVAACTRRRAPHAPSRAAASRLRSGCTGRAPRTTRRAPRRSSPTTAACLRCNLHRVECVRPERCIRARRVAAYAACVRCPVGAVQLVRCWQRRLLRRPLLTAERFCESRLDLATS